MIKKKEERLKNIRDLLVKNESMRNIELAKALGITIETLRHDLDYLEEQGIVIKEHGYTRINNALYEMPFMIRQYENVDDKKRVSLRAFQEIQDGQIVFFDSGSTLLAGIEGIRHKKEITIVTNSLPLAMECTKMNQKVILIGGMVNNAGFRTFGSSYSMLDQIHMDLAITCTAGFENTDGFTSNHFEEIGFRRQVLKQSSRMIVICDRRKFHQHAPYKDVLFREVDLLITNPLTPEERDHVREIKQIIEV